MFRLSKRPKPADTKTSKGRFQSKRSSAAAAAAPPPPPPPPPPLHCNRHRLARRSHSHAHHLLRPRTRARRAEPAAGSQRRHLRTTPECTSGSRSSIISSLLLLLLLLAAAAGMLGSQRTLCVFVAAAAAAHGPPKRPAASRPAAPARTKQQQTQQCVCGDHRALRCYSVSLPQGEKSVHLRFLIGGEGVAFNARPVIINRTFGQPEADRSLNRHPLALVCICQDTHGVLRLPSLEMWGRGGGRGGERGIERTDRQRERERESCLRLS